MNILNGTLLLAVGVLLNSAEISSQMFGGRRRSSNPNVNQIANEPMYRVTAAGYLDETGAATEIQSGSTVEVGVRKDIIIGKHMNGQVYPFLKTLHPQSARVIVDTKSKQHYELDHGVANPYADGLDNTASAIVTQLPPGKK
ncbi:uncharacterized protein LOC117172028 [Belonocnema kinseyi]|uniref:uncharacterized protein LOC117172028 n=1 Tax=Belonocnema kinseyi TaxID=2817044 RepID=UPI00143DDB5A|nr:uncharacterized protein LOC117172028 [Belonocnema kinseyi]